MSFYSIFGLTIAMFLLAITPGPGVFATVSKALASGFRSAIPVVAGIVVGDLVFLMLAIFGLAAIAEEFAALFTIIKYLGAGYLIYLGIKLVRSQPGAVVSPQASSGRYSFFAGLSITLGNPKVILFYLGFLPTFVDMTTLATGDIAIVATIVSVVLGTVMAFYAFTASRARKLFRSSVAMNRMNKTAGGVMIGTGSVLLAKA